MIGDTDELPFLLLYGAWVWKLVLALGFAAAVLAIRAQQRRRARVRAGITADALDHAGVIRGKLHGAIETVVVTRSAAPDQRTPPIVTTWHTGELWLETDQGRVAIEGPIEVVAGSRVIATRHGIPHQTRPELVERACKKATWIHPQRLLGGEVADATVMLLGEGDEVVATGTLEQAPSQEPGSYRASDSAWTLRRGDAPVIRIAARLPGSAALRLAIPAILGLAVVTLGGGYLVAKKLGGRWQHSCAGSWSELAPVELTNTHACALAAATPIPRTELLEDTLSRLDRVRVRDDATLRQTLAVAQLAHGCSGVAQRLHDAQRFGEAATVALACGDLGRAHAALVSDGRFAEACTIHVPVDADRTHALPEIPTLIACDRWREAADAVDARALAEPGQQPHHECVAQLLRHHAGEPGVEAWLRAHQDRPACAIALAELVPAERDRLLRGVTSPQTNVVAAAHSIAAAAGTPLSEYELRSPEEVLVKPAAMESMMDLPRVWLVGLEAKRLAEHPEARTPVMLRWLAVSQTFRDDLAGARRSAAEAQTKVTPAKAFDNRNLQHLAPAIALYGDRTDTPVELDRVPGQSTDGSLRAVWQHAFGRLLLRAGKPLDVAYFGPDADFKAALFEAMQGDGIPLARYLTTATTPWWADGDVLAVFPQIQSGRDAVRAAVVGTKPREANLVAWHAEFGQIGYAIERRAVLRIVGATAEAARWDAIVHRLDAMLSDRRRLVALLLWNP
ncbi:MAG: hypothetical protein ABI867_24920 [Kofleriaceae bacterium]